MSGNPAVRVHSDDGRVVAFTYTPGSRGWSVAGEALRGPHGLVITRLEISVGEAGHGVTGGVLREIQVGDILHHVRALATGPVVPAVPVLEAGAVRRGGRAMLSDDLLREVAVAYLAETAAGRPPGAVRRMAAEFSRPEETVRSWIARARRTGWLGPSVKGRAGAEPGPKLQKNRP